MEEEEIKINYKDEEVDLVFIKPEGKITVTISFDKIKSLYEMTKD